MRVYVFLCIVTVLISVTQCARILGVFHAPSYSHYILGQKVLKALAARGHEVTAISPYPQKAPLKNYKDVVLTGFEEEMEDQKRDFFTEKNFIEKIIHINKMGIVLSENTLKHSNVQKLLKSNEKFDAVILVQFINDALKGFCHHYQAPCILFGTGTSSRWTNPQVGNPAPLSYVPNFLKGNPTGHMNFFERLQNLIVCLAMDAFDYFYLFPAHNKVLQTYFPGAPHLNEIFYNTSLILLNSHISYQQALPFVPNIIPIGGFHVDPPKALPQDLKEFLDNAKEGVVFFSLGSNIKSKDMPAETRNFILRIFSKLKQKVLWKWEDEKLPGQPPNIKLSKWLPQQDVLAHPNVQLFITHGGLLSTIEAIYHGVPLLALPVFGDQETNAAQAEAMGYAISVPFVKLTEEKFAWALNELLSDKKYKENVQVKSNIMHDQELKPLDKAVFWVEYVIRHRGAPHLRVAGLDLKWYQYYMIDVVIFLTFVTIVLFLIFYIIFKHIIKPKPPPITIKEKKKHK